MVDATEEKELAERFEVRGFPSLKFFRGDPSDPTTYTGGRTERDIVAYMKKKTSPPVKLVVDLGELEAALKAASSGGDEAVLVAGFFEDVEGPLAKLFERAAAQVDDFEFVSSADFRLADEVHPPPPTHGKAGWPAAGEDGAAAPNCVVVFKSFDERRNVLPLDAASSTTEAIRDFINAVATPKVIDFTQARTKQIFKGPVKVHLLTFYDPAAAYAEPLRETLEALAEVHRGRVLHLLVPQAEDRVMSYFGVDKKELPRSVLSDVRVEGAMRKYNFNPSAAAVADGTKGAALKAHRLADLEAFEAAYFAGELTPDLKSEEDKPSNMRGKVKVLTGQTFERDVLRAGRDVLVKFHAPWCGHCKALAPKWDELGDLFAKAKSPASKEVKGAKGKRPGADDDAPVWIAKMDATANEIDHPDVTIKGFPSIILFPADGSKPIKYDGGRETEDFVEFLKDKAVLPFEMEDGSKGGKHDEL
mmetsp:Transcript_10245/g.23678  ORF Transcript_10245/g.23678 Transcript_10245/m.23678 type:complete len:475 (+) Transcript_10245:455-1879(+)|eukprot:CAMPEP_0172586192 /NCGR_PEP_ID=MMETSP1068-20121228/5560_1 /TAXON_ID=35684 /ORGANISM="Pseudopedinella elastica, Strain CCMP716" /LENGTH=474 /DNA_ID=CAMNT_0013380903 /DNA_START=363 /DNA_END=1787 /DNA_ORIENTATION=-